MKQPLSPLQKSIIALAYERKFVGYTDILDVYYGFTVSRCGAKNNKYFSSKLNSRRQLQVARVAICKSFNRLVKRGIVNRVHDCGAWSSITLTGGGCG